MSGRRRAKYFPRVPQGSLITGTVNVTAPADQTGGGHFGTAGKAAVRRNFGERHYETVPFRAGDFSASLRPSERLCVLMEYEIQIGVLTRLKHVCQHLDFWCH